MIRILNSCLITAALFLIAQSGAAQRIGNYISNGSFEDYYECTAPFTILKVKHWLSIDSSSLGGGGLSVCNGQVPKFGSSYQYPHSGESLIGSTFYYIVSFSPHRTYSKNRLKATLQAGKTYCVRFYVNITNPSTYGIDGFGAYFGGNDIDTITKC